MKKSLLISVLLGMLGCCMVAEGSERGFGKSDIDAFCAKSTGKPSPGIQLDGKRADADVMRLQPGKYRYPKQGALLLFPDAHFLLQLPTDREGIHGTSGDDLLASGGIVGGCSKEQLSEALQSNRLQASSFERVTSYQ